MKNEQAMVDRLKTTWTAFGGLTKEEQEFLKANYEHIRVLEMNLTLCKMSPYSTVLFNNTVYRLSPDFQLPVERWFYSPVTHLLSSWITDPVERKELIEVSPDNLAYVRSVTERKDIDLKEWEYRKLVRGEKVNWIWEDGHEFGSTVCDLDGEYRFVSKPKPEANFVEYPVTVNPNMTLGYRVELTHLFKKSKVEIPLHKMPSVVGFAGFKFALKDGTETDWLEDCPHIQADGKPAKCIKVRCFVTE